MSFSLYGAENPFNVVDFSGFGTSVLVLTCFVVAIVFFFRLRLEDDVARRADMMPVNDPPAQIMHQFHNPFTLTLTNSNAASLKDGVLCALTSSVRCVVHIFWAVHIDHFYPAYYQHWSEIQQQLSDETFLTGHCQPAEDKLIFDADSRSEVYIECDEPKPYIGIPPRDKYSLVVSLTDMHALHDDIQDESSTQQIVNMVSLIHLKDDQCSLTSHIIAHYVRTRHEKPQLLKPLYVSNAEDHLIHTDNDQPSDSIVNDTIRPAGTCIVCQSAAVSCVLLPCRHTCMCHSCRVLVDACPMCRAGIYTHFSLFPPEEGRREAVDGGEVECRGYWTSLNESLNRMFGFT